MSTGTEDSTDHQKKYALRLIRIGGPGQVAQTIILILTDENSWLLLPYSLDRLSD